MSKINQWQEHRSEGMTLAPLSPDAPPRICAVCGGEHRRTSLVCSKACAIAREHARVAARRRRFGVLADPLRIGEIPATLQAGPDYAPFAVTHVDFGARFDWVHDWQATNGAARKAVGV